MKIIKEKKLNRIALILTIIGFPLGIFGAIFAYYNPSYTENNIDEKLWLYVK